LKKNKLLFDEEFLQFLDQRNQAKLQWLQDSKQSIGDNLTMEDMKLVDISGTIRRNA
jgi:hypothetical protein